MVIESRRTRPVPFVAFAHAKVVHVVAGRVRLSTRFGWRLLTPGDVMVLGRAVPCAAVPAPEVRTWTICLDEDFLRRYMLWALPQPELLLSELRTEEWDNRGLFVHLGTEIQRRLEPLLRCMSVLPYSDDAAATAKMLALFAKTVELSIPHLVSRADCPPSVHVTGKIGRLTSRPVSLEAERAASLLRNDLAHAWTITDLGRLVSLSRSQLSRRFVQDFGVAPMRWLAEVRTTEFARLIEETALPIDAAAREVGWTDRRVAAAWFRRRYGVSPIQFRR